MNTIRGTWVDGRIVLDHKTDWPDGTRVEVSLSESDRHGLGLREEDWPDSPETRAEILRRMNEIERSAPEPASTGIRDEDWPRDPDGIARLLALMDQVEPFEMSEAEIKDWEEWRAESKKYTIEHMYDKIDEIFP